jgi:gas vesicle protein
MGRGRILTAFAVGAAAGAILGLLFAPHKGEVTRKKIAERGQDIKEDFKEKVNDLVDTVASKFQHADRKIEKNLKAGKIKSLSEEEADGFI